MIWVMVIFILFIYAVGSVAIKKLLSEKNKWFVLLIRISFNSIMGLLFAVVLQSIFNNALTYLFFPAIFNIVDFYNF
mgnify:CR=1 FL=1